MQCRGLLFHPDDDPADIIVIQSGEMMFRNRETEEARFVLDALFAVLGDGIYSTPMQVVEFPLLG